MIRRTENIRSMVYLSTYRILKDQRSVSGIFHKRGHATIVLLRAIVQSSIYISLHIGYKLKENCA